MSYIFRPTPALLLACVLAGCSKEPHRQYMIKGANALKTGQYEQAALFFENASKTANDPKNRAAALNFQGVALARQGRTGPAENAFMQSAGEDKSLAAPLYNLAMLKEEQGLEDETLALLEQAALAEPNDTCALEYAASLHMRHGRLEQAQERLDRALIRQPHSASVLTALAIIDIQAGRNEAAIQRLEKIIARAPNYAPALFNLAVACSKTSGAEDKAAQCFARFIALSPDGEQSDRARAALSVRQSRNATPPEPDALEPKQQPTYMLLLENARMLASKQRPAAAVNVYLRAADLAGRAGQPEVAKEALARAQAVCPPENEPRLAIAGYWLDHGRPDLATPLCRQAAASAPNHPDTLLIQAKLALAEKDYNSALQHLSNLLAVQPKSADALWMRAVLFEGHLSMPAKGAEDLNLFIQIHPADPRASEARSRLRKLTSHD